MGTARSDGSRIGRRQERLLIIAIVAMIASFAVAQWSGHAVARAIHNRAEDLSDNAAPSIAALSALRLDLKSLELACVKHSSEAMVTAIDRRIEGDLARYEAMPSFEGEDAAKKNLHNRVDVLHGFVDHWRSDSPMTPDLESSIDRAITAATTTMELNSGAVVKISTEIDGIRARSQDVAVVLFALSTLLAFATAFLLVRMFQRARMASEQLTAVEAARADELERFAGRIAHDILSPLSSTMLAMGVALGVTPEGSPAHKALERGQRGLTQARSIVSDLYEFARSGARPTAAPAELREVVRSIAATVEPDATNAGVTLEIGELPDVNVACAPGVLTSILANLLGNAVKYTAQSPRRLVKLNVLPREEQVRFEVCDTGPGIPESALAMVFEPFHRLPSAIAPGLGLGLATVKRLCEAHRGSVGVLSGEGEGSTFWVELPRAS